MACSGLETIIHDCILGMDQSFSLIYGVTQILYHAWSGGGQFGFDLVPNQQIISTDRLRHCQGQVSGWLCNDFVISTEGEAILPGCLAIVNTVSYHVAVYRTIPIPYPLYPLETGWFFFSKIWEHFLLCLVPGAGMFRNVHLVKFCSYTPPRGGSPFAKCCLFSPSLGHV